MSSTLIRVGGQLPGDPEAGRRVHITHGVQNAPAAQLTPKVIMSLVPSDLEAARREHITHGVQKAPARLTPKIIMSLAGNLERWSNTSWGSILGVKDFSNLAIWRAAVIELVFDWLFVFSSIAIAIGSNNHGFSSPLLAVALAHFILMSLIIRAAAPSSGAHFNPGVTLSAMFSGKFTPVRTFMYIVFQCLGAVFGAICAKDVISIDLVEKYVLGGCTVRTATVLDGGVTTVQGLLDNQAFLVEFIFSFILQWMNFSVGLDERQFKETGLTFFPFLMAGTVALNTYVSGSIAPGFGGAAMNPARCFGPAMVYGGELLGCLWIFLLAPAVAALATGLLYNIIPPNHVEIYREKEDFVHRVITYSKPPVSSADLQPSKAASTSSFPI